MRTLFTILLTVLFGTTGIAQVYKYTTPSAMHDNINSDVEEIAPVLVQDKLFFSRSFHVDNIGGAYAGADIWFSEKDEDNIWQKASKGPTVWNNKGNNALIGKSANGNTVYLINSYYKKGGIAFSSYFKGNWTKPELIEIKGLVNDAVGGVFVAKKLGKIILSIRTEEGHYDLFLSNRISDTKYGKPIPLGVSVNTPNNEITPFLDASTTFLYFASDGHEGFGGYDIFVAERLYNSWDVWAKPINLGKAINSQKFDGYFNLEKDSTVIFASNKHSKFAELYAAKFLEIASEELEEASRDEFDQLQESEVKGLFGFVFSPDLEYDVEELNPNSLSSKNTELIYFLGSKLKFESRIVVILNTSERMPEKTKELLRQEFSNVGIPVNRIVFEPKEGKVEKGKINITFGKKRS